MENGLNACVARRSNFSRGLICRTQTRRWRVSCDGKASEKLTLMDSLACTMLTAVNEPKRPLDRVGSRVNANFSLFSPRSGTRKASRRILSTPFLPPHARARLEKVIYFYDAILFRRRRIYIRFEHMEGIIYVVATKAQSDRINFHIAQSLDRSFSV
jgi:hypothetical protein